MKKNVLYRVTTGDLLIKKGIPFCKNRFPDINYPLLDFFHRDSSLFPVSINSSVINSIMEKLWEAIDPYLAQTVNFYFHWTLKEKKLANNHNKQVPLQIPGRKHYNKDWNMFQVNSRGTGMVFLDAVLVLFVNFEHILQLLLVFLILALSR